MENINQIYIINLQHRKDRWEACMKQLNRYNIRNYVRFDAIKPDLNQIDPVQYSQNNLRIDTNYIRGSLGCKLSHLNIIKHAKQNNIEQILILEDDFLMSENFIHKFNSTMQKVKKKNLSFDMLYLGFSVVRSDPYIDTDITNLKKLKNCHTTHAYMLNKHFYDTIINEIETCYCEIDVCYANLQKKNENIYGISPCLIGQRESYSDILNKNVDYKKSITLDF
jgi:GR25 family glycosyltransferase involved in LPS biosynthesis